ncbi:MAG: hypothetical protein U1D35_15485 [Paracoccaceae bacterium]|nr:hypothetical protein [Paracoccaceae bacterium]
MQRKRAGFGLKGLAEPDKGAKQVDRSGEGTGLESEQSDRPGVTPDQAGGETRVTVLKTNTESMTDAEIRAFKAERRKQRITDGAQKVQPIGAASRDAPQLGRRLHITADLQKLQHVTPIRMPNDLATQPLGAPQVDALSVAPPAQKATARKRHRLALYSFALLVLLPFGVIAGYLGVFAQDQFASEAGFSVRKEEGASSVDMLGGLSQLAGSASTDAEILYDFIKSPDLVRRIDKDLDLIGIFGRNYQADPLFSLAPDSTIEKKLDYWRRMVTVKYNESTGLIALEVRAFTPQEAQTVAQAILDSSSLMINRLSEAAREDATRYARVELARSVERLKEAREAITRFRSRTQVVDPIADIEGQMGLMSNLQGQLAEALIELDILKDFARGDDPRNAQAQRRIEVINKRLAEERRKFGMGTNGDTGTGDYASIVAEYERLVVDREVAEGAFRSATMIFEVARAEAQRKSRYLAAHVAPTLAEGALYPNAMLILAVAAFFLILGWAVMILVFYSIRDRR